jgi:polar amino acid transport system substrate-binding protein
VRYFLFSCLLTVICLSGFADAEEYQIVTEEWAPYNYLEDGVLKGISVDIVEAIMKNSDVKFKAMVLPTMRTTKELNDRPKTIMFSMFRTKEREKLYKWVGPIIEESIFPYALNTSSINITSMAELKSEPKITTRAAGLIPRRLESLGFDNLDKAANQSEQLYKMLITNRTRIIVGDTDLGARYYLKHLKLDRNTLKKINVEIFHSELYVAFSLDSDDSLVKEWNDTLARLRREGKIDEIISKYSE